MLPSLLPLAITLVACNRPDYGLTTQLLSLEVSSPEYGVFLGDQAAAVTGRVTPAGAQVSIEGQAVQTGENGDFNATVLLDGLDYRVIDIEASIGDQVQRQRIPVFSGHNPVDSWPGQATARLTTTGLDALGTTVGGLIDATGWDTMITDAIPSVDTDYVDVYAVGLTHQPTVATLVPGEDGIATTVVIDDISLEIEINALDGWVVIPIVVGFDSLSADVLLEPQLSSDGMLSLLISDATVDIGAADFKLGALDGWLLELAVDAVNSLVEPLADLVLQLILDQYGEIDLGGPLAFQTDLLGTSLAAQLSSLWTDTQGIGAGLGIGIDADASSADPTIPTPGESDGLDGAQASIAVHEGAVQLLLDDTLISLLSDFDLGGIFGSVIGAGVQGLPGGDQAPSGDGWCISMDPGDAYVVRMKPSLAPLAQLHMPDFRFTAGVENDGACEDWLDASLEVTIDIGLDGGTALDLGVEVPDGALLYYGADPDSYTQDEVIAGLGDQLSMMVDLAGGLLGLDLGSLLGGLSGDGTATDPLSTLAGQLDVQVTDSRKLYNDDGSWTEGLYVLSLNLFAE
ncbi:MAG: hypothetical protein GXP62_01980 [Oligoflexia bacterium]|nr:hypothetical protein [Oligoflexia bacterium]